MQDLPGPQRDALVAVTVLGLSTRRSASGMPSRTGRSRPACVALRKLRDEMGVTR